MSSLRWDRGRSSASTMAPALGALKLRVDPESDEPGAAMGLAVRDWKDSGRTVEFLERSSMSRWPIRVCGLE